MDEALMVGDKTWAQIESELNEVPASEEDGLLIKRINLGTFYDILPSKEYWTIISNSHVTADQISADMDFITKLKSEAKKRGISIEDGLGDPIQLFAVKIVGEVDTETQESQS